MDKSIYKCSSCGLQLNIMKRCVRCRKSFYCSRECQVADWMHHRKSCIPKTESAPADIQEIGTRLMNSSDSFKQECISESYFITVKSNHKKHKLKLSSQNSGEEIIDAISKATRIPNQSLKLIGKGKLVTSKNVKDMFRQKCRMFQALGEEAECEDGIDSEDILAIMDELHVSRNIAIRSLRSCNGDLIDAILALSNNS